MTGTCIGISRQLATRCQRAPASQALSTWDPLFFHGIGIFCINSKLICRKRIGDLGLTEILRSPTGTGHRTTNRKLTLILCGTIGLWAQTVTAPMVESKRDPLPRTCPRATGRLRFENNLARTALNWIQNTSSADSAPSSRTCQRCRILVLHCNYSCTTAPPGMSALLGIEAFAT